MRVFKFGGASVKDAESIKNVANIVSQFASEELIVVASAMGKTTNLLEQIHQAYFDGGSFAKELATLHDFHLGVVDALQFSDKTTQDQVTNLLEDLATKLAMDSFGNFGLTYDRIVPYGELLSTTIVQGWLAQSGVLCEWLDVRNVIVTNEDHQQAEVDWVRSAAASDVLLAHMETSGKHVLITQGFIGQSPLGNTTTLGREGSDFSAAILAYLTNAEDVTIWKDVPGMLNADPKWFNNTIKLDKISYREALELSYYGASVIHPKTIKPLQNKGIPLYVKSFTDPTLSGSVIQAHEGSDAEVPSYIFKTDQTLVTVSPKDFSFVAEKNLLEMLEAIKGIGIKMNLMQNSALSFSFVMDKNVRLREALLALLQKNYTVRYNDHLELLTVRHYDKNTLEQLTKGKETLLEQKSRNTVRVVLRANPEEG